MLGCGRGGLLGLILVGECCGVRGWGGPAADSWSRVVSCRRWCRWGRGCSPPGVVGGCGAGAPVVGGSLTGGVDGRRRCYQRAHVVATGLDADSGQAVDLGGAVGVQGRAASGVIRDQARAVGAATAVLGRSPAGVQLIMATMDQHLAAMQRQLDQTTAQNRLLALRLRQLAAGVSRRGVVGARWRVAAGRTGWAARRWWRWFQRAQWLCRHPSIVDGQWVRRQSQGGGRLAGQFGWPVGGR